MKASFEVKIPMWLDGPAAWQRDGRPAPTTTQWRYTAGMPHMFDVNLMPGLDDNMSVGIGRDALYRGSLADIDSPVVDKGLTIGAVMQRSLGFVCLKIGLVKQELSDSELLFATTDIEHLLARSYTLVPPGTENDRLIESVEAVFRDMPDLPRF